MKGNASAVTESLTVPIILAVSCALSKKLKAKKKKIRLVLILKGIKLKYI
jgi:hypothetical protein